LLVELVQFFRLTHNAAQHLRVAKENCWAKYCTGWLRSKYKWRHSNDVIVIKISVYIPQLNSLQNVYFQNFIFWKLREWCRFVTYLLKDPRIFNFIRCSFEQQPHKKKNTTTKNK